MQQVALKQTWEEARTLVMESVIWRIESSIRYKTLNKLTTDWDNVIVLGVTQSPMNLVDETRLGRLGILITESQGDIVSGYRAIGQILGRGDNASGTSGADNNTGVGAGDTSGTRDASGTGSTNNNSDSKHTHVKAGFSTYNIARVNTYANVGDTTGMRDVAATGDEENNTDGKNAFVKVSFSTYNVAGAMQIQVQMRVIQVIWVKKSAIIQIIQVKVSWAGQVGPIKVGWTRPTKTGQVRPTSKQSLGWVGLTKTVWMRPTRAVWVRLILK